MNIEEGFVIDSDSKAEWAILKIKEHKEEADRMIKVCQEMIEQYKQTIEQTNEQYEQKTEWIKSQLHNYFENVPKKATKTQETYKLPSGTLKRKFGGKEFVRDDEKLLGYLKENKLETFVKIKESIDWAEFKKTLEIKDGQAIDQDGQIVDGIRVETKEDRFEVEL